MTDRTPHERASRIRAGEWRYRGHTLTAIASRHWEVRGPVLGFAQDASKTALMLRIDDAIDRLAPVKCGKTTKRANHRTKTGQLARKR